ncbi:MAG: hypothetical protein ACRC46_03030 [Thermoguttaceae bacterium]
MDFISGNGCTNLEGKFLRVNKNAKRKRVPEVRFGVTPQEWT